MLEVVTPPPPATAASVADEAPTGRQGAKLYFVATGVGQSAALLRYVALARLLGPEQLGLAATLVVTGAFFDLISDTASDRFLIQDRHGADPSVQSLVHFVYIVRGFMIAGALALFSIPLAAFYKAPQLVMGFIFLGLTRLVMGFTHLDYRRVQRELDFRPEGINMMASEIVGLAVTVLAAWLTHNFTAILYGLTARSVATVVVSHMTATRKYGVAWSREHGPRLTRFSTPLMMTGLLLFVSTQGDRVFIGNQLGPKTLGEYSATLLLIYSPAAVILRYIHALYVPMVAARRDDHIMRDRVSDTLGSQTLLLAIAMAVGFAVVAPYVVTLLYGSRFAQSAILIGLVGILTTTRFLINWPTTVALSMGRSGTILVSNIAKLAVFPCAFAALWIFRDLNAIISGFVIGEMFSIGVALALLNRDSQRPWHTGFDRLASFLMAALLIIGWDVAVMGRHGPFLFAGLIILSIGFMAWLVRREGEHLGEILVMAQSAARKSGRRNGPPAKQKPSSGS